MKYCTFTFFDWKIVSQVTIKYYLLLKTNLRAKNLGLFSKSSKPCICTFVHLQPVKVLCISEFLIYENKKFNLNLTYCFPKCAKEIHLFKSFTHWSYKARNLSQKTIGSCYRTSTDFIAFQNPSTF